MTFLAQDYSFSPGKTFYAAVDYNQLNYNGIEITNNTTFDLNFSWELLLKDTLVDCEFDLCNSGICFDNLAPSGNMPTISPSEVGYLKMHMFSGLTNGINTIKYVLRNNLNSSIDTLTFIVVVGELTGIQSFKKLDANNIALFPNPTSNETALTVSLVNESNISVSIINNVGQVVFVNSATLNAGSNVLNIDTKQFAAGIYNVVISTNNGSVTKKLSVTK